MCIDRFFPGSLSICITRVLPKSSLSSLRFEFNWLHSPTLPGLNLFHSHSWFLHSCLGWSLDLPLAVFQLGVVSSFLCREMELFTLYLYHVCPCLSKDSLMLLLKQRTVGAGPHFWAIRKKRWSFEMCRVYSPLLFASLWVGENT